MSKPFGEKTLSLKSLSSPGIRLFSRWTSTIIIIVFFSFASGRMNLWRGIVMLRQYRLDRYNGLEILVCEVFHRHTWTQSEYDAFSAWSSEREKIAPLSDFVEELNEWLNEEHDPKDTFFGLVEPISFYDSFPAIVLRGVVVDNRPASLQVDYIASVLSPEIVDEVNRFYGVFDSRHWRNMVSHQLMKYGSLFDSDND